PPPAPARRDGGGVPRGRPARAPVPPGGVPVSGPRGPGVRAPGDHDLRPRLPPIFAAPRAVVLPPRRGGTDQDHSRRPGPPPPRGRAGQWADVPLPRRLGRCTPLALARSRRRPPRSRHGPLRPARGPRAVQPVHRVRPGMTLDPGRLFGVVRLPPLHTPPPLP